MTDNEKIIEKIEKWQNNAVLNYKIVERNYSYDKEDPNKWWSSTCIY